jgi:CheY-like chemotaxis protein
MFDLRRVFAFFQPRICLILCLDPTGEGSGRPFSDSGTGLTIGTEAEAGMSAQRSVLVVDDDPQLLRLMARLFDSAGHRTLTAANLPDALALFDAPGTAIDLAVLDVNLAASGGGGAAELLPLLRDRAPGLEVVLISGDELPASLEQALSANGGRFLRKPFPPKALLRVLDEPACSLVATAPPRPGPPTVTGTEH